MLVVIESKFVVAIHEAVHRIKTLVDKREEIVVDGKAAICNRIPIFGVVLQGDRIKRLATKKRTRSLSHLFGIGDYVSHTHHEGIIFLENGFSVHPCNKRVLVANGITPRQNQGTERNNRK